MGESPVSKATMAPDELAGWAERIRFVGAEAVRTSGASAKWKRVGPAQVRSTIWPRVTITARDKTERVSLKRCRGSKEAELGEITSAVLRLIRRASGRDVRTDPRTWDEGRAAVSKAAEDVWRRTRRSMGRAARRKGLSEMAAKDAGTKRRREARTRLEDVMRELRKDLRAKDVKEAWKKVCDEALVQRVMES